MKGLAALWYQVQIESDHCKSLIQFVLDKLTFSLAFVRHYGNYLQSWIFLQSDVASIDKALRDSR
jgi:hypothetical protein